MTSSHCTRREVLLGSGAMLAAGTVGVGEGAQAGQAKEAEPAGYSPAALDRWADVARGWSKGESPAGLDYLCDAPAPATPRETFVFFISGDKIRNPAAAEALTARLQ